MVAKLINSNYFKDSANQIKIKELQKVLDMCARLNAQYESMLAGIDELEEGGELVISGLTGAIDATKRISDGVTNAIAAYRENMSG